jgi:hypothetical protein
MTRRLVGVLMLGLAVGFTASAKDKVGATPAPAEKKVLDVVGTVLKTDGPNLVVQTRGKNASEVTVVTDANTKFELKGNAAALKDIKPGMQVVVTPNTGTAQKVVATETLTKKDKEKAKKKKDKEKKPA